MNAERTATEPAQWALKRAAILDERIVPALGLDEEDEFEGIRCPLCRWQPAGQSRWCCDPDNSPEPFFPGCHTTWNTFATGGCCPGCNHQWVWTSCLSCHGWSLHADWYEIGQSPRARR
jgi:hypothetical protein